MLSRSNNYCQSLIQNVQGLSGPVLIKPALLFVAGHCLVKVLKRLDRPLFIGAEKPFCSPFVPIPPIYYEMSTTYTYLNSGDSGIMHASGTNALLFCELPNAHYIAVCGNISLILHILTETLQCLQTLVLTTTTFNLGKLSP